MRRHSKSSSVSLMVTWDRDLSDPMETTTCEKECHAGNVNMEHDVFFLSRAAGCYMGDVGITYFVRSF